MKFLCLENEQLLIEIDPGRGADILSVIHKESGVNVLFSTPWRHRADNLRDGVGQPVTTDSVAIWMEQYRGGWQILCPNPGAPRYISGAPVGFHGEASVIPWRVDKCDSKSVVLQTDLFMSPLRLQREMCLHGKTITIADKIENLSSVPLLIDFSSHPAFGGAFLEGNCTIDTGAASFILDSEAKSALGSLGSSHTWPWVKDEKGKQVDLRKIATEQEAKLVFGWLTDFKEYWAQITNLDLGLSVRLEWDGTLLPYAWLWEELNTTESFPWFKRARVVAIEPSSAPTSGSDKHAGISLPPYEFIEISVSLAVSRPKEGKGI